MKRAACAFAAVLAFASTSVAAPRRVLGSEGLGAVQIGMTVKEAEKALGARLRSSGEKACTDLSRRDGRERNIRYMAENGRISRIDVTGPSQPRILTAAGIGIGASEEAVRRAYGAGLVVERHPYDPDGHYLKMDDPDHSRGIIFETAKGRVTSFRAGRYPALGFIEGCA